MHSSETSHLRVVHFGHLHHLEHDLGMNKDAVITKHRGVIANILQRKDKKRSLFIKGPPGLGTLARLLPDLEEMVIMLLEPYGGLQPSPREPPPLESIFPQHCPYPMRNSF